MVLMILGALLIVGGFASVIYGNFMNNDFSTQLSHYDSGFVDPGNIWMILGVIAIIIGIVMVVCGPKQIKTEKRLEKETGGATISSYQRNILKVYQSQLDNGVITKEEYQVKKEKLLNEE